MIVEGKGRELHYERRDSGFFIVWAGDSFGGLPGERVMEGDQLSCFEALGPAVQISYQDLRIRLLGLEVDERGRCVKCDEYVPPLSESGWCHMCKGSVDQTLQSPTNYLESGLNPRQTEFWSKVIAEKRAAEDLKSLTVETDPAAGDFCPKREIHCR